MRVESTQGNMEPGFGTDYFCKLGSCLLDNTTVVEVLNPSKENITNSLLQPSYFFAVHALLLGYSLWIETSLTQRHGSLGDSLHSTTNQHL